MSQAGIISNGGSSGGIVSLTTEDSTVVLPDGLGNINVLGGPGITTTGNSGTHTVTIVLTGSGDFEWSTKTSGTNVNQIAVQNGYITGGVSQVDFILPTTANVGDRFAVTGFATQFQIQQNSGQQVIFGSKSTTAGTGGSLTSTNLGDHAEILCVVQNVSFKVIDSIGNLTVV